MALKLTVKQYYNLSWRWLIILLLLIVLFTESCRTWVIVTSFIASLLVNSKAYTIIKKYRTLWVSSFLSVIILFLVSQVNIVSDLSELSSLVIEALFWLLPITLAFREQIRSYWFSLLNISLISIGSVLVSSNLAVYILLIFFLFLIVFNMNSATLFFSKNSEKDITAKLPGKFFNQFWRIFPAGLMSMALIFFAFPRVKNFSGFLNLGKKKSLTGYTGTVDLSGGREIGESEELVLVVQSRGGKELKSSSRDLLFRGNTVEIFDGKSWRSKKRKRAKTIRSRKNLKIRQSLNKYIYDFIIFREPSQSTVLFYPGVLITTGGNPRVIGSILIDDSGNLNKSSYKYGRYSYNTAVTDIFNTELTEDTTLSDYSNKSLLVKFNGEFSSIHTNESLKLHTQVPSVISEKQYFKDFVKKFQNDYKDKKIRFLLSGIKKYFALNFKASLINNFSSADTFKAFLTADKRGHCEYFSTATVLLLRSLGIPSRIVLGYRGGEYNEISKTFDVKEKNAHAWLELFIPDLGWYTFDPTPGTLDNTFTAFSVFKKYYNAATFVFNKYIIDYNSTTQRGLFRSIQDLKFSFTTTKLMNFKSLKTFLYPIILIFFIGFLIIIVRKIRRDKEDHLRFPSYYKYFLNKLNSINFYIKPGETLSMFHQRLVSNGFSEVLINEINQQIEHDLYSQEKISTIKRKQILNTINSLNFKNKK